MLLPKHVIDQMCANWEYLEVKGKEQEKAAINRTPAVGVGWPCRKGKGGNVEGQRGRDCGAGVCDKGIPQVERSSTAGSGSRLPLLPPHSPQDKILDILNKVVEGKNPSMQDVVQVRIPHTEWFGVCWEYAKRYRGINRGLILRPSPAVQGTQILLTQF